MKKENLDKLIEEVMERTGEPRLTVLRMINEGLRLKKEKRLAQEKEKQKTPKAIQ